MLFFIPFPNSAPPAHFTIAHSKIVLLVQPTAPNVQVQPLVPFAN